MTPRRPFFPSSLSSVTPSPRERRDARPAPILILLAAAFLGPALLTPGLLSAQVGIVEGRVRTADTGEHLSGIQISVEGTALGTLSSEDGWFRVAGVPEGEREIRATALGYNPVSRTIQVRGDETVRLEIALSEAAVELGGITVVGRSSGYVASETRAGTKIPSPLVEVPQSISLITRERMASQAVETQAEALRYTAGIQPETFGPDMLYDWMQIRGFQQYGQNLYRDGLQLRSASQAALRLNPYGAERMELLRGPASVLYGQGSAGGFLNYVSKTPRAEPSGEVTFQTGSYDRVQGAVDVTGPLDDDGTFLYRLTGLARSSEAQVDFSEDDQIFVAPALTWRPTSSTELTVLGDFQHDDAIRGTSFLPAEGTVLPNPNGTIPVDRRDGVPDFDGIDRDQFSVGHQLEHAAGDRWTLRSKSRYTSMENDYQISWGGGLQDDRRTLNRFWFSGLPTLDIFTLDNNASVRFLTGPVEHTVLAGVDFQRHILDERWEMGSVSPLDVFDPEYGNEVLQDPFFSSDLRRKQTQVGLYVQNQLRVDRWTLVLSGRRDEIDTETRDREAETTTNQSNDAWTGRVGLVYGADSGLNPYVSYSKSFLPLLGSNREGDNFEPERGRQVEVGAKYEPRTFDGFVSLALFDLRRQDVLTPNAEDPNFQSQTGEIRSRGVELEGVASPTPGLDVVATYTFLDTEVTESNAGDEGKRPIIVPEHSASLWLDYRLRGGPLGGVGLSGGVRHIGSTYGDAQNTLEVPAYTLFDAGLSYEWDRFRLGVTVHNLFDNVYVASCFTAASCFYGTTRTVRADLGYRW